MLEIACFNEHSAIAAAKSGADRVELCVDYAAGGLTPPHTSLRTIGKEIHIPVNVMIRPRAGNFIYSETEFERMKSDIQVLKPGANGFVFGVLNRDNTVDKARNRELADLASPLPCTFHRAIDQAPDLLKATEVIIDCGFKSILTSGGPADAVTGASTVGEMQKRFGEKISFILGGGIRAANIESLRQQTETPWYHSAAITGSGEDVDGEEVRRIRNLLDKADRFL